MQTARKRILRILFASMMIATMLVALPPTAHAATATINVGVDIVNGFSSASPMGDALWSYDDTVKMLYLRGSGDSYTLTGTNTALHVMVDPNNTVTLDHVSLGGTPGGSLTGLYVINSTVELIGPNTVAGRFVASGEVVLRGAGASGGSLEVANCRFLNATISLIDEAHLATTGSVSWGIEIRSGTSDTTINIESGCSIEAIGTNGAGIYFVADLTDPSNLIINCDGVLGAYNITGGGAGYGIVMESGTALVLECTVPGTVIASGYSGAISTNESIYMGYRVFLNMINGSGSAETHDFVATGDYSIGQWLIGAAGVLDSGTPDAQTIRVSIPTERSAYVERWLNILENVETGKKYMFFEDAFDEVDDGETLQLLTDVSLANLPSLFMVENGKSFIFDTNGKKLDFSEGCIHITDSDVEFLGCENLVNLGHISVSSYLHNSKVVFNGDITLVLDQGLDAFYNSEVILNGDLASDAYGILCMWGATVTVNGNVSASHSAIDAVGVDSVVTVTKNVSSEQGYSIECSAGAKVNVDGNVIGGESGILCDGDADGHTELTEVFVGGDVSAADGVGVTARSNGQVTVDGAITASEEQMLVDGTEPIKNPTSHKAGYEQYTQVDDPALSQIATLSVIWVASVTPPGITGPTYLELTAGYGPTSTGAYTVTGDPSPTVTQDTTHGGRITWNDATNKLDIAAGLAVGEYAVVLTATNGIGEPATAAFTLKVVAAPPASTPPAITGPTVLAVQVGYAATSAGPYTVTGDPAPTVTQDKTHGGSIVWNAATSSLDVAAGLAAGTYTVVLTAANDVGEPATLTFILTVSSGGTDEIPDVPKTGDDFGVAALDLMLLLAGLGAISILAWNRRRYQHFAS